MTHNSLGSSPSFPDKRGMDTERIIIGNDKHDIEVRPLTIIARSAALHEKISYPDRVEITPEYTVSHGRTVKKVHEDFAKLWDLVFSETSRDVPKPCDGDPDLIRQTCDIYGLHLLGLIDLSLKLSDAGTKFVWKFPETYLHPALQCSLADVAIEIMRRPT